MKTVKQLIGLIESNFPKLPDTTQEMIKIAKEFNVKLIVNQDPFGMISTKPSWQRWPVEMQKEIAKKYKKIEGRDEDLWVIYSDYNAVMASKNS